MIIDHPFASYNRHNQEPFKAVQCDFCGKTAAPGDSIDTALDNAYRAGFSTRPGRNPPISPRKWCCPTCRLS